jgi:PKD repeat protein
MRRCAMRKSWVVATALGVLLLLPALQVGIAAAQPPGLARAIAAQEKHNPLVLSLPGVAGTGVGVDASGAAVIRVYIESRGVGVPAFLDNVPVESVVTGRFYATGCAQSLCPRPVPLGVSTGHPDITAGTIGARVKDASGNVYALSNNHVYANSNNASIGDGAVQPGPYDGGTDSADRIGTLAAFKAIDFSGDDNDIDAAIALSSTAMLGNATLSGYTPTNTPVEAAVNLPVKKEGRTTGLTLGQISEVNVTATVCYAALGPFCVQSARYVNQFAVGGGTFSAGGDSGSLIVTQSGNDPVGLLFAGSSTRTIANRIQAVLAYFGVTIDSSAGGTNNPPIASFTYSCTGLTCNFDGTTSSDTDGSITSYAWNFGDGNSGAGVTTSHTYSTGGTYTVVLTVTDDDNAPSQTSQSVTVSAPSGPITLTVVGRKVKGLQKADLTWSPSGTSTNVDVRRNGVVVTTTSNDGAYTDNIDKKGGGSYSYQICEAGTSTCSNVVTITF